MQKNRQLKTSRSDVHVHLTLLAALLAMLGPFTVDTYLPSFPDIASEFAVSRSALSQTLGVYLAAFAVSMLFWGPLADSVGRRPVILISLIVYTLASIGCAFAADIDHFLIFRGIQGLAASGGFIAGRAMIRDAHDGRTAQQAMSQVMMMFALAPAVAPLLGGWLHVQFGWHSVFWFLTAFALLLVGATLFMRETLPVSLRKSLHPLAVWQTYQRTVRHGLFLTLVLSMSLSFAGLFLYIVGAPVVIYDFLGLGATDFGWLFIPMVAGMMMGSALASRKAHRWAPRRMISLGFALMLLAWLLNLLQATFGAPTVLLVIAPMVIYAFGLSLSMPGLTILAMDCFPSHRGTAASTQGFLQMTLNAVVASIAVPLLQAERLYFVLGQGFFLIAALILWLLMIQRPRISPRTDIELDNPTLNRKPLLPIVHASSPIVTTRITSMQRTPANSPQAAQALTLVTDLQQRFAQGLESLCRELSHEQSFEPVEWFRDNGTHGGGIRLETADGTLFGRGSVNVSQVHYDDNPAKQLGSATAISTIIHPCHPLAPSVHIHLSWTEMKNGNGYWRVMADLNPSHENPAATQQFLAALKQAAPSQFDEAKAQGERYFFIPALNRHRGVAHFYLEGFNTGDAEADLRLATTVGKAAIDSYLDILSDTLANSPSATQEQQQAQLAYHTLYFFQVLTLDRGTTSGLLVHDQNDVGILASIPALVDSDLLRSWLDHMQSPQEQLLNALIATLPDPSPCLIDEVTKEKLANVVREHYICHPEAIAMQASGNMIPPTVSNHR